MLQVQGRLFDLNSKICYYCFIAFGKVLVSKREHIVKYITVIFMVLFTLLKATQYNYPVQFVTTGKATRLNAISKNDVQQVSFLRHIDKSLIERFYGSPVPPAKCLGTIFAILSVLFLYALLQYNNNYTYPYQSLSPKQVRASLCIFRL
jgi:hypothetical protein